MPNKKKILVPIDFSDQSINALSHAAEIADKINAEILVLHVIETYDYNTDLNLNLNLVDNIRDQVEAKLKEFQQNHVKLWGIPMHTHLVHGKIHEKITEIALVESCSLIVMGTHGAVGLSKLSKFFLGSNAYRVVSHAPCPVITVRDPKDEVKFKNILLPLDLSKNTTQKVDLAVFWAKEFGATIHILSAYDFLDEFHGSVENLEVKMEEVEKYVLDQGIETYTAVVKNRDIANSIMRYAEEEDIDLIFIMTRQESRFTDRILGTDARKIIERSASPVLSLHPKKN